MAKFHGLAGTEAVRGRGRWRWPRRLLIGTGATLLVGALVGFVVAPPLIRRGRRGAARRMAWTTRHSGAQKRVKPRSRWR